MHYINIKYGPLNHCLSLQLNSELTVSQMKQKLAKSVGANPMEIAIIFAGNELHDDLRVSECDLGNNSIIHAVKIERKTQNVSKQLSSMKALNETLATLTIINTESDDSHGIGSSHVNDDTNKSHFYVYCSSMHCKKVMNGKLRVICSKCKNGTLIVRRDPKEWDDVLVNGRISGVCQSDDCDGETALFYFKCASTDHNDSYDDNSAVILYLLRRNTIQIPCLACTEISAEVLVFPCQSGHVICLDCFKDYCLSRLNERRFIIDPKIGYTLNCAVGCPNSMINETHHFRLMGDLAYQKYQTFAAEECLLSAGGVLCPHPNCGAGILIEEPEHSETEEKCNKITCVSCSYVFCRNCLQGYHIGECIDGNFMAQSDNSNEYGNIDSRNADQSKWYDQMSINAIKGTTKPCPKCRTPTERDGGCMHMVCTRSQCGFNWCWVCQTQWNRECMGNHWFG